MTIPEYHYCFECSPDLQVPHDEPAIFHPLPALNDGSPCDQTSHKYTEAKLDGMYGIAGWMAP